MWRDTSFVYKLSLSLNAPEERSGDMNDLSLCLWDWKNAITWQALGRVS